MEEKRIHEQHHNWNQILLVNRQNEAQKTYYPNAILYKLEVINQENFVKKRFLRIVSFRL